MKYCQNIIKLQSWSPFWGSSTYMNSQNTPPKKQESLNSCTRTSRETARTYSSGFSAWLRARMPNRWETMSCCANVSTVRSRETRTWILSRLLLSSEASRNYWRTSRPLMGCPCTRPLLTISQKTKQWLKNETSSWLKNRNTIIIGTAVYTRFKETPRIN